MIQTFGNTTLITMDDKRTIIELGYISIENYRIVALGPMEDVTGPYTDMKGTLCIPGLLNTHTHLGLIPFRSMADDMPDRLRRFLLPMESEFMDKELIEIASRYAAYESLCAGTTTVVDMYYESDAVATCLEDIGIRAWVGQTIIKDHALTASLTLDDVELFLKKWSQTSLITPMVAPHAPYSVGATTLNHINKLCETYDAFMMMHVSEMDFEMDLYKPNSPIQYLDSLGVVNERLIAVHCIHTSSDDQQILANKKARVVHCPNANMKAGKGIADVIGMLRHHVPVSLGTDGPVSGNTLDMMSVMKTAAIAQKTRYHERDLMTAETVFALATCDAARLLNRGNDLGQLREGFKADIVFVDTSAWNMQPIYDYYSTLVYSMQSHNVKDVYVNGVVKVRDFKLIDEIESLRIKQLMNAYRTSFRMIYQNRKKREV